MNVSLSKFVKWIPNHKKFQFAYLQQKVQKKFKEENSSKNPQQFQYWESLFLSSHYVCYGTRVVRKGREKFLTYDLMDEWWKLRAFCSNAKKGLPKSIKAIKKNYTVFHDLGLPANFPFLYHQLIFLLVPLFRLKAIAELKPLERQHRKKITRNFSFIFIFNLHSFNILPIVASVIRYSCSKQQLLFPLSTLNIFTFTCISINRRK